MNFLCKNIIKFNQKERVGLALYSEQTEFLFEFNILYLT